MRLPVDNPTTPFWYERTHPLHDEGSKTPLPKTSDVVIIGAGYAGVATAYNLVKGDFPNTNDKKLTITILEARSVCSGATGRNGGHLRPDLYGHIPKYIKRHDPSTGEDLAIFEIQHVQALKRLIATEKIDCDFNLTRSCDVWVNREEADKAKVTHELMLSHGFEYMDDVCVTEGPAAEMISGVKGAKLCKTYTAATLSPYKFITHLLSSALSTGRVALHTHTPVQNISPHPDSGYIVQTHRGAIHAQKIIHATNAYASNLLPEYAANIIPCKGICCHISVPKGVDPPLLDNSYIVRGEEALDYLISRPDGSIIVGGASKIFTPKQEQWYNVVNDGNLIEAVKGYYNGYMQRTFRGWENSGAEVRSIWTGIMGYSFDSNPHVGLIPNTPTTTTNSNNSNISSNPPHTTPNPTRKNQYILAGFNGHGMPVIWLAAKGIAEMVLEEKEFEEVSTKMPMLLKTTEERITKAREGLKGGDILNPAY